MENGDELALNKSFAESDCSKDTTNQNFEDVIWYPDSSALPKIDFVDEDDDNMDEYIWDGPEDSDEEIEYMTKFKNKWEHEKGVKFSKKGLAEFIDNFIRDESTASTKDWE